MGDERTPSWFWPLFVGGLVVACAAIFASGVAGVGLIASRVQYGSGGASGSCPSCGPAGPRVYVPVTTPIASGGGVATPVAPTVPVPPVAIGGASEGSLVVDVVVRESHGRAAPRSGSSCALALDFHDVASDGAARCEGRLRCGERTIWRAEAHDAVACSVDRTGGTVRLHDGGFSADVGRPLLDVEAGPSGVTLSVADDARAPRGAYSIAARSE